VLFLGTLNKELDICRVDSLGNVLGGQPGCYNLIPVFDWIRRSIVSIFLVFFIAFLPLFLQGVLVFRALLDLRLNDYIRIG
jgi:1,3-beta-glucan synthase